MSTIEQQDDLAGMLPDEIVAVVQGLLTALASELARADRLDAVARVLRERNDALVDARKDGDDERAFGTFVSHETFEDFKRVALAGATLIRRAESAERDSYALSARLAAVEAEAREMRVAGQSLHDELLDVAFGWDFGQPDRVQAAARTALDRWTALCGRAP